MKVLKTVLSLSAAYSFRFANSRVRLFAILSVIASLIAVVGGYLHIESIEAGSALMGDGFISTYAFFFMTLYYTK